MLLIAFPSGPTRSQSNSLQVAMSLVLLSVFVISIVGVVEFFLGTRSHIDRLQCYRPLNINFQK